MTVSIIIAVKTWQKNLEECVAKCLELDYPDFEIIVLPDDAFPGRLPHQGMPVANRMAVPINIIPTGPVSPAHKRDIAMEHAKGDILAFIDDDAYPVKDWLTHAVRHFADPQVGGVGGPAVTPANDNYLQKVSGAIYSSRLVSGNFVYRYLPRKQIEVDDYPSCNLLVRASVMRQIGGFDTKFWPGEDTKLCLDITKKLKNKIIYDPAVLVYHHRREVFGGHLKQILNYAMHRGYFVKKFPQTSLKLAYFVPSLFVLGLLVGGLLAIISQPLALAYSIGLFFYIAMVLFTSLKAGLQMFHYVFFGIILTHLTYGIYFLKGLILRKLPEE